MPKYILSTRLARAGVSLVTELTHYQTTTEVHHQKDVW